MKTRKFLFQCFVVIIFCHSIFAQQSETFRLTGRILDLMGSVVPNINIVAYSSTKTKYESTADENGIYNLNLPKGFYNLEVNSQPTRYNGFGPIKLNNYQVVPVYDGKLNFDIVLPIEGNGIVCELIVSGYPEKSNQPKSKKNNKRKN